MKLRTTAAVVFTAVLWTAPFILSARDTAEQKTAEPVAPAPAEKELSESEKAEIGREKLIQAYKKEFAFLENEQRALETRLKELDADGEHRIRTLKVFISNLDKTLLSLKEESAALEQELIKIEAKNLDTEDISESVFSTLSQATMTLSGYGVPDREFDQKGERNLFASIGDVFTAAIDQLGYLGGIKIEDGNFYLSDGTETKGKVIRVGSIAALGASSEGSGTLAPAGGGKLKIWDPETKEYALELNASVQPDVLPVYIYESLERSVERDREKTWGEIIKSGGVIAYVIVGLGILGALFLLLRSFLLWRSASNTAQLISEVTPLIRKQNTEEALTACRNAGGAASRVLATTVKHLNYDPGQLEDIIAESILHETPKLDRFASIIRVFAAVAPLLGLLGTVTGMISTFDVITIYGTGDPKLLSGGISEALITTQLGLMVAIPLLLLGNLLSSWSGGIKSGMENGALRITNVSKGYEPLEFTGDGPSAFLKDNAEEDKNISDTMEPAGAGAREDHASNTD